MQLKVPVHKIAKKLNCIARVLKCSLIQANHNNVAIIKENSNQAKG